MLKAINLTKSYGSTRAVCGLNLSVSGELFVFLGPNGAGKTTTIKMMTGLLAPDAGEVFIGEHNLWKTPEAAKQQLGLVPDAPFLYEKLTGREFIQFMADLYQVDRSVARIRIDELLALFELETKADELIQTYSYGMRRKCAICGALVHNPLALFLDEPTAGLDPHSVRNLRNVLRELVQRGVLVFLSTHILEIAEHMCDRVGILNQGKLIAVGTMPELRAATAKGDTSLEDIFFELTQTQQEQSVLKYLDHDVDSTKK